MSCFGFPTKFHHEFIVSDLDGNVCETMTINATRWRFLFFEDRFRGTVVFSSYDTIDSSDRYRIDNSSHLKKEAGIKDDFYYIILFGNYDESVGHSKYANIYIREGGFSQNNIFFS